MKSSMYIKFLAHGKGDPSKASSYLIDEVDHLNRPRPDIQVLRGDPQTFTALAQSIQNDWIYTSGVIAWSKSDNPTDAEVSEVLDEFEKHAFAGLQPNQYHFTAVLHEEDDGSKHVHFLVPRIELETGKALNIAPQVMKSISTLSGTTLIIQKDGHDLMTRLYSVIRKPLIMSIFKINQQSEQV